MTIYPTRSPGIILWKKLISGFSAVAKYIDDFSTQLFIVYDAVRPYINGVLYQFSKAIPVISPDYQTLYLSSKLFYFVRIPTHNNMKMGPHHFYSKDFQAAKKGCDSQLIHHKDEVSFCVT